MKRRYSTPAYQPLRVSVLLGSGKELMNRSQGTGTGALNLSKSEVYIVTSSPKIGSNQFQPYSDKLCYGYLHAAIKDAVTNIFVNRDNNTVQANFL